MSQSFLRKTLLFKKKPSSSPTSTRGTIITLLFCSFEISFDLKLLLALYLQTHSNIINSLLLLLCHPRIFKYLVFFKSIFDYYRFKEDFFNLLDTEMCNLFADVWFKPCDKNELVRYILSQFN